MSHQSVVEAAVQAAARQGIEATIIVLGTNGSAPTTAVPEYITVEHEHYHSATEGEAGEKLAAMERHIAMLTEALTSRDETITEMRAAIEGLRAAPPLPTTDGAQAQPTVEQPAETVSIDSYAIDVLGIPEEIAKKVRKVYTNIGALREAAATGKLGDLKLKGGQKAIIDIQERLLGRVPSERIPASAPAASTGGGTTEGVPAGHSDRPWLDRLGALKAKERDMAEWAGKLAAIQAEHPDETNMPDAAYDALMDARHEHDIAKSQVVALVWGLGLDKEHLRGDGGNVDACLAGAGLSHLTDNPQPRLAPQA